MTKDLFQTWTELSQSSFETLKKLGELNVQISERLLQEQMEIANQLVQAGSKNLDVLGKAKAPQDVLSQQSALAEDYSKQLLKSYRSCADVLAEARDSYNELFEETLETANKTVKETTTKKKSAA